LANPCEVLTLFPNLKSAFLYNYTWAAPAQFPQFPVPLDFRLPSLTELNLACPRMILWLDELLFLLSAFPNLSTLSCSFSDIVDFDEPTFRNWLPLQKPSLAKVKKLKIFFREVVR
jgi:hypothetical protein